MRFIIKKKKLTFLIEEKDLNNKLYSLLNDIYKNKSLLDDIISRQSQYSDKNVYENINRILEKIFDEKN